MANPLKSSYLIALYDTDGTLLNWRFIKCTANIPEGWVIVL